MDIQTKDVFRELQENVITAYSVLKRQTVEPEDISEVIDFLETIKYQIDGLKLSFLNLERNKLNREISSLKKASLQN